MNSVTKHGWAQKKRMKREGTHQERKTSLPNVTFSLFVYW
jgi:hypothetical protein